MFSNLFATYNLVDPPKITTKSNNNFIIQNNDILDPPQIISNDFINFQDVKPPSFEEQKVEIVNNPISQEFTKQVTPIRTKQSKYTDRNQWVTDLKNAYIKAGVTNTNTLKMLISQDALESAWGKSTQGNFNYGNITPGNSWKGAIVNGSDHDSKGNKIKQKFRSYNSIEEYAQDKIQFLKRLYDFDENDNINQFVYKLQGGNGGKRKYAESPTYQQSLLKVYNSFKF